MPRSYTPLTHRWMTAMGTLLLAFVLVVLPSMPASACSCAFMEPDEALARGDVPAAFVGTLVSVEDEGPGEFGAEMAWTFEVEAVLAGDLEETTVVRAPADDGANCGLMGDVGDRMGLLLYSQGDHWSSSSCSTYDADALLAAGDPEPPVADEGTSEPPADPVATESDDGGGVPVVPIAVAGILGLAVLGGVAVFVRR